MPKNLIMRSIPIVTFCIIAVFLYFFLQLPADRRMSAFFINKAVADTSLIILGTSFLLGPLAKLVPALGSHLYLRRYFGLGGFFLLIAHLIASLIQYAERFPLSWYVSHMWGVIAGVVAALIFLILAYTSRTAAIHWLGGPTWKTVQRTGYIALLLVLVHVYVASQSRWQMWLAGSISVPSSFIVFAFTAFVLIVRLLALLSDMTKKTTLPKK